jgi:hypothetical protein
VGCSKRMCFSILPSQNTMNVLPGIKFVQQVLVLTKFRYINELASANVLFSNESLHRITQGYCPNPTVDDYNQIISRSVEVLTNSLRHDAVLNNSLSDLSNNHVHGKALNLLSCTMSPLRVEDQRY